MLGDDDQPRNPMMPVGWTPEKEELFVKCWKHARDCRERAGQRVRHVSFATSKPVQTEEDRTVFNAMFDRLFADERVDATLRQHMKENILRFEWLFAALFSLIGRRVWTPGGMGTLLSVCATKCEIQREGVAETFRVSPCQVSLREDDTEFEGIVIQADRDEMTVDCANRRTDYDEA